MFKKNSNKGFTIIELIVVIAIVTILILFAMMRFNGYTKKSRITLIRNDVKVAEGIADEYLATNSEFPKEWNSSNPKNSKRKIYDITGLINTIEGDNFKIIPNNKINTKLSGTFHVNEGGKVYYEDNKNFKKDEIDKDGSGCEILDCGNAMQIKAPNVTIDHYDWETGITKKITIIEAVEMMIQGMKSELEYNYGELETTSYYAFYKVDKKDYVLFSIKGNSVNGSASALYFVSINDLENWAHNDEFYMIKSTDFNSIQHTEEKGNFDLLPKCIKEINIDNEPIGCDKYIEPVVIFNNQKCFLINKNDESEKIVKSYSYNSRGAEDYILTNKNNLYSSRYKVGSETLEYEKLSSNVKKVIGQLRINVPGGNSWEYDSFFFYENNTGVYSAKAIKSDYGLDGYTEKPQLVEGIKNIKAQISDNHIITENNEVWKLDVGQNAEKIAENVVAFGDNWFTDKNGVSHFSNIDDVFIEKKELIGVKDYNKLNMYGGKGVFFVKAGNTLYSWGSNSYGELGTGRQPTPFYTSYDTPEKVAFDEPTEIIDIKDGDMAIFALDSNSNLWFWGNGINIGQNTRTTKPVKIEENVKQFDVDYEDLIILKNNGDIKIYYGGRDFKEKRITGLNIETIEIAKNNLQIVFLKNKNTLYLLDSGTAQGNQYGSPVEINDYRDEDLILFYNEDYSTVIIREKNNEYYKSHWGSSLEFSKLRIDKSKGKLLNKNHVKINNDNYFIDIKENEICTEYNSTSNGPL